MSIYTKPLDSIAHATIWAHAYAAAWAAIAALKTPSTDDDRADFAAKQATLAVERWNALPKPLRYGGKEV